MNHSVENPQLIYIAGHGRSGSTLLDVLLGNLPHVFGTGELRSLFRRFPEEGVHCSCCTPLSQCSFWRSVLDKVFRACPDMDCSKAAALTRQTESITGNRRKTDAYIRLWRATFQAIREVSGKPVIVDSSKSDRATRYRVQLFARRLLCPVKVVHLVRDPRAVMWSAHRGNNRLLEKGSRPESANARDPGGMFRALLGWYLANQFVERLPRRNPSLELELIRYEDLVCDPDHTFTSLGTFLGMDLGDLLGAIRKGEAFDTGHGVTGNRMQRNGPIRVKLDDEWRRKLPKRGRISSWIARPLMKRYGYS